MTRTEVSRARANADLRRARSDERRRLTADAERLKQELVTTIKLLSEIEPVKRRPDVWSLTDKVRLICSDLLDAADGFKGETGCRLCGG